MLYTLEALKEEGIEDGVYIDLDGDKGLDLEAIEDQIDGNAANEDEIQDAQEAEFGDFNPVAESYMIMYEAEYNWNRIQECVGRFELNEAAAGRTPILEGADLKGFINKTIAMLKRIVERLADIVKAAIYKFTRVNVVAKKMLKMNEKALAKASEIDTDNEHADFEYYNYRNLKDESLTSAFKKDVSTYYGKENGMDHFRGSFMGDKPVTAEKFREEYTNYLRGDKRSGKLTDHTLIGYAKDTILDKDRTAGFKKAYKAFEDDVNEKIKNLKETAKKLEKGSDELTETKNQIGFYKDTRSTGTVAMAVFMNTALAENTQATKIISKVLKFVRTVNSETRAAQKASKKSEKKTAKNESALFSNINLL